MRNTWKFEDLTISKYGTAVSDLIKRLVGTGKFKVKIKHLLTLDDGALITSCVIFNKEHGVSVQVGATWREQSKYKVRTSIRVKVRTSGSGYRVISCHHSCGDCSAGVADAVQAAMEALSPDFDNRVHHLKPWEFSAVAHICKDNRVSCASQLNSATVVMVVTVDGGVVCQDGINAPGATCWYLVDCLGRGGATFNIITDGEVFYPTNRVTPSVKIIKLVSDIWKASVDLSNMNQMDKSLITAAIRSWVEKLNAN